MSEVYPISAKISVDTSGFKKGINDAQKSMKGLKGGVQNIGKSLTSLFSPGGVAIAGVALAVKAFQKFGQVINETTELYKKQNIAEQQLRQAVNNNPYVTGESTKALLDYASALQKASNYGDEELIPFMTKLISSGRTEAETMKIMQTALDMSATGAMDLNTAVTQLNATMNGNVGRLGQQNAELKALSKEELEAGKAVDILSEKFKGQSELSIDSSKQLKNAWGDLKETFGKTFEKALGPMRKFFAELVQGWADARKARQEYNEAEKKEKEGTAGIEDYTVLIDQNMKKLEEYYEERERLKKIYSNKSDEWIDQNWEYIAKWQFAGFGKEQAEALEKETAILNAKLANRKREEEARNKAVEEENKLLEIQKEKEDLQKKYTDAIAEQEAKWKNIETVTGNAVALDEKRSFYQDQLVGMLTESNGELGKGTSLYDEQIKKLNTINSQLSAEEADAKRKKQIEDETKAIENLDKQLFEKRLSFYDKDSEEYHNLILKKIEMAKEEELEQALTEEQKLKIQDKYFLEVIEENKRYREIKKGFDDEEKAKNKEKYKQMLNNAKNYTKAVVNVMKKMVSTIVKLFSKGINLNLDDLMNSVLELEDKILTFFVETLPKIPGKVSSILDSVAVLLESITNYVDIEGILTDIFTRITKKLPAILKKAITLVLKLAKGILTALYKWIESGGAKELIESVLDIIKDIFNFIVNNLPMIIDMIIKLLIDIVAGVIERLPEIIVTILKALPKIIESLVKGIWNLIKEAFNAIGKGFSKAWKWFKGIMGWASGTNSAQRGLAVVGEQGPELVDFRGGEKVYNATDTRQLLNGNAGSNASGGNTFNVTFNNTQDTTAFAMMRQLKTYQRNLAFNGVL